MQGSRQSESDLVARVAQCALEQFQHQNIIKAKKRPFTNSAVMSLCPPLYLEANIPSLSGIMRARFLARQAFTEEEVLNVLEGVVFGLAYLQTRQIPFGDVHPNNIFFDQLRNCYKIGNPYFTQSGLRQVREGKRMSLLSPEQISSIYDESYRLTPLHQAKSDLFVLGMHLLEICNLDSAEPCYNNEMRILNTEVQKRVKQAETRYSPDLMAAIRACLDYDVESRVSPLELGARLVELRR